MAKQRKKHKRRNHIAREMIERTGNHAGAHHNREHDVATGKSRKRKHKKSPRDPGAFHLPNLRAIPK